tara:strand:- start:56 stop:472 length:417 start_codon:yes stop_codon:yes gene_type:complete
MNKLKTLTAIMMVGFLLQACASGGNQSLVGQKSTQVDGTLIKGKTTKAQVENIYGDPMETSFTNDGNIIYKYRYDDASGLNAKTAASVLFTWGLAGYKMEGTRLELVVLFDENEIVKNHNFSSSDVDGGTGLFAKNNK